MLDVMVLFSASHNDEICIDVFEYYFEELEHFGSSFRVSDCSMVLVEVARCLKMLQQVEVELE